MIELASSSLWAENEQELCMTEKWRLP